ncbi:MAG: hypothetical protein U0838_06155 [Chloroflexota bacterium]
MEALLLTVAMLGLMVLALALMARYWPRSSSRTGFHISGKDAPSGQPPAAPEDDDARWRWKA